MISIIDLLIVAFYRELGTCEIPINDVKYNTWYYGREVNGSAYKWCVTGIMWLYNHIGYPLPIKTNSCTTLINYAKKVNRWYIDNFKRGDLFFVETQYGKHIGIVEQVINNKTVKCLEFNSNDCVRIVYRSLNTILGVYRPEMYDKEEDMTKAETQKLIDENINRYHYICDVPKWYRPTLDKLVKLGYLAGSGGSGEFLIIDLMEDTCRCLVILDRAGAFNE